MDMKVLNAIEHRHRSHLKKESGLIYFAATGSEVINVSGEGKQI